MLNLRLLKIWCPRAILWWIIKKIRYNLPHFGKFYCCLKCIIIFISTDINYQVFCNCATCPRDSSLNWIFIWKLRKIVHFKNLRLNNFIYWLIFHRLSPIQVHQMKEDSKFQIIMISTYYFSISFSNLKKHNLLTTWPFYFRTSKFKTSLQSLLFEVRNLILFPLELNWNLTSIFVPQLRAKN